jgi:hypothetical protein
MLQALMHKKIDRWLSNKNPWEIEDLLTSVVFGSCKYAGINGWKYGLRHFLAAATNSGNKATAQMLDEKLPSNNDILTIEYDFWPSLSEFSPKDQCNHAVTIAGAIPEVILTITNKNKLKYFLLVEVKLNIGKSSSASSDPSRISDQLAKYWEHLKHYALERSGEALAIVYVTTNTSFPHNEIEESMLEIKNKLGGPNPPIFWVSWRQFVPQVALHTKNINLPILLTDLIILLSDRWGLIYDEIKDWPNLLALPQLNTFTVIFGWKLYSNYTSHNYSELLTWIPKHICHTPMMVVDIIGWPIIVSNFINSWAYSH